ncbi:hypothetical protein K439DRAFT_1656927 [Ramaria rubella]|nr:hypothetical protein K439DRAFT_1656927 [Ramaria rubella]
MSSTSCVASYPPDLLYAICSAVYSAALPAPVFSLDPLISQSDAVPTVLPSSYPPANWPEPLARKTLASLCLVNKVWHEAAKSWLYRKVEVRLPRNWLAFVDEITGGEEDGELEPTASLVDQTVKNAAMALGSLSQREPGNALRLQECVMETLTNAPDGSIPPELLSPPASRDPSPGRLRAKSPGRWRLMKSISDAVKDVTGMYVPTPPDHRPGRHTRSLDFNHFRTIGMRRSVEEGMTSRFVTGDRVERVLQEMLNLEAFGATEYMDGALTFPVLSELLLRGRPSRDRGRASRSRTSMEDDAAERLKDCKALEALDFCGCVSSVFVNALDEFIQTHLRNDEDGLAITLPGLQRLGLRGVRSVPSSVLTPFVLAFPSLTHLDLSGTLCSPDLLRKIACMPTLRLTSLALARCARLTSESITHLLVHGSATYGLKELSLYGDMTFSSALTEPDLLNIVLRAPCFTSGQLRYLDLSSCPVTPTILKSMSRQPTLRSLGLAHIPLLPLSSISAFMLQNSPNVEILTLVNTSPEFSQASRQASLALHSQIIQPLATAPFSFSLTGPSMPKPPPTHLRVVELATNILSSLGGGAGSWRMVRSKGGRGWYVDTASGWIATETGSPQLRRDLPAEHPFRIELTRLADSNGNVSSGVGWHARKMEVLHGHGMLGREDGLYGAVSFAYHA